MKTNDIQELQALLKMLTDAGRPFTNAAEYDAAYAAVMRAIVRLSDAKKP